jgi:arylsulfatase A-like enzyme
MFKISLALLFLFCVSCGKVAVHTEIDLLLALDDPQRVELDAKNALFIHPFVTSIHNELYWGIHQHAPSNIVYKNLRLGKNAVLEFGYGVAEHAWCQEGDGVTFVIDVLWENQKQQRVFTTTINPKANEEDRQWFFDRVSLGNENGEGMANVYFRTLPGADNSGDNAVWVQPKIISEGISKPITRQARPNVILITMDTVRYDYLACNGNPWIETPNLDRLAREGVTFDRAYAPMSTTTPSHASMLNAMLPYSHGVINNDYHLAEAIPRLPKLLKEMGYTTGAAVSVIHLDGVFSGLSDWFDTYQEVNTNWQKIGITDMCTLTRNADTSTSAMIEFVEEAGDAPFFFWAHYYDPHAPYEAIGKYHRKYYTQKANTGTPHFMENVFFHREWEPASLDWIRPQGDLDYFKKEYGSEISYVDQFIGKIHATLERLKMDDNTIIIVTADHGENLGDHDIYFDHWTMQETDIHVPLIFWAPKRVPGQIRVDEPVSLIDIAPTVLDLLGETSNVIAQESFDGISLTGYWRGEEKPGADRIVISQGLDYTQTAAIGKRYKVVWELRRLLYHSKRQLLTDRVWLYDLEVDPEEQNPVGSFYFGEREPGSDPWKGERGIALPKMEGKVLQDEMDAAKERVKNKTIPSVEDLRNQLVTNDSIDFIDAAYAENMEFLAFVIQALARLQAEVNPRPLSERLKNLYDISSLKVHELESVKNSDPAFMEYLKALGYVQ